MPLLGKNRFKCQPMPDNLSSSDEVYICKATGEVFTDYEKFFDQTILCNSLIWSCEVTGHSGMTFAEALESEKNSRRQLETFPLTLRLPILHLASLTRRTIFKDLLDDVFGFAKDRYFIGETIIISTGSEKKSAVVIKVFPMANRSNQPLNKFDIDGSVVEEDGKKKGSLKSNSRKTSSDSCSFQYMSQDQNTGITIMSTSKNMSRNRNLFNRDSCKLFLREHCEHKGKGIWKLRESVIKKYNLLHVKFGDYFAGHMPNFPGLDDADQKSSSNNNMAGSEKKDLSVRKKEIEKSRNWSKARDDLMCDDLKDLPVPNPIVLFGKDFGSAITVMEFLSCFSTFCGIELPNKFSIGDLDKCLNEQKCDSIYLDLIQGLLVAIFQMQLGIPEMHQAWKVASKDQSDAELQLSLSLVRFFQSVEKKSKAQKSQPIQDTPLRQLPLDSLSITEIVRLHLLVGYYEASAQLEGTLEVRIEHTSSEFNRSHPDIMRKLQQGNILDLSPSEKLKVLSALVEQVLSLPACRDFIEENYSKLKNAQKDLRTHMWAVQKREKDLLNYNFKKKQEEEVLSGIKKRENPKAQDTITTRTKKSILDLKDKDFEDMPMEGIDWDQLSQQEKDHIKNWSDRRQLELQAAVEVAQGDCCLFPIGMDRTYRRYWMFRSTPGLFVEDSKVQDFLIPPLCLNPQDSSNIKKSVKFLVDVSKNEPLNEIEENLQNPLSFMNVHDQLLTRGNVEWSFYSSAAEFKGLVERLNSRGIRESQLKNYLLRSRERILNWMNMCEVELQTALQGDLQTSDYLDGRNQNNSVDADMRKGEIELSRTIADMILDLEERVFAGGLGQLKVNNVSREDWRTELGVHDFWSKANGFTEGGPDTEEVITKKTMKHLSKCLIEVFEMVDVKYLVPPMGDDEELKQRRLKLLTDHQLQHSLESIDKIDDAEASNSQESFHNGASSIILFHHGADISKWKELVHKCSNFSQLYLCLFLLDSSIAWSRSALNARCRICRKKRDGESMLLCDGCNQGHHMYCLKPPLKKVPEGDWFCSSCQPKNLTMISPRKVAKNVRYKDYDSDFGEDDDEGSLSSTENLIENISLGDWKDEHMMKNLDHKKKCREKPTKNSTRKPECSSNKSQDDGHAALALAPVSSLELPIIQQLSNPLKSRSGREIIRPRGNEEFIDELLPSSKLKKRDRSCNIDELYVPEMTRRKHVRSNKYTDDFDYDNNDEEEDCDDEEELEYVTRRRSSRKRRCRNADERDTPPLTKKAFTSAGKYSQRKTNASMKAIEDLVTELMKNDDAWPFLKPVTLKQAPDYFDIIEKPMDLSTIKYKIYRFEYKDQNQIIEDLRLMLYNCNLYNCPNTPVHDAGMALEVFIDKRLEEIEKCSSASTAITLNSTRFGALRKRTSV